MDVRRVVAYIRLVEGLPGEVLRKAREAHGWGMEDAQQGLGFAKVTTGIAQIGRWEAAGADFKPRSPLYRAYLEKLGLTSPAAEAILQVVAARLVDLDRGLADLRADVRDLRASIERRPIDIAQDLVAAVIASLEGSREIGK